MSANRKRVSIRTEVIGEREAFEEGQRELADKGRLETYLPCIGGPLDGKLFRVPSFMLQSRIGSGESPTIEIPAAESSGLQDHLPRERRLFATYRLDRSSRVWRFVKTAPLGGDPP